MGRRWAEVAKRWEKCANNVGKKVKKVGKRWAEVGRGGQKVGKMCPPCGQMWAKVGMWAALKMAMEDEGVDGLGWEWVRWKAGEQGYKMRVVWRDLEVCQHPDGPLG